MNKRISKEELVNMYDKININQDSVDRIKDNIRKVKKEKTYTKKILIAAIFCTVIIILGATICIFSNNMSIRDMDNKMASNNGTNFSDVVDE